MAVDPPRWGGQPRLERRIQAPYRLPVRLEVADGPQIEFRRPVCVVGHGHQGRQGWLAGGARQRRTGGIDRVDTGLDGCE